MHTAIQPRRLARLATGPLVALAMVAGVAACGSTTTPHRNGAGAHGSAGSTATSTAVDAPTKVSFGTGSVGPADPTTTVPTERGNPIPPDFAAGQNIIITSSGFQPQTLEANVSAPVVWTNLSGAPQRLIFQVFPVDSGTIPPGGTFTWSTTSAVAIAYRSTSGFNGKLQMNPVQP